jgi:hypothetical protein
MGQFKPMVKMMTTEPTVELKLKKGGSVKKPAKMMNGGVMGALSNAPSAVGARGGMAPVARPKKPSMAARRAAMKGAPMGRPMMKEGGDAALEKHASMPASKAHKGLKTGGVVMGQGGFKKGGAVPKSGILPVSESERGAKGYVNTKMKTAEFTGKTSGKTGEVKLGNAGGYKKGGAAKYAKGGGVEGNVSTSKPGVTNTKTGGVRLGNAGGYKKGGGAKKMAMGGLSAARGKPRMSMQVEEEGNIGFGEMESPEIPEAPKYMKGGAPKKAFATGGSVNDSGRPVAYPKKPVSQSVKNNLQSGTFKRGGGVKMKDGGLSEAVREGAEFGGMGSITDFERKMFEESMAPMAKEFKGMGAITNKERELLKKATPRSVTKTEKSVTVTPAKKRGGSVKC